MALKGRRRSFVDNYLQHRNAAKAARDAGYSVQRAGLEGWELLKEPEIAEEIERRAAEHAMKADEVLARLGAMARGSVEEFIDLGARQERLDEIVEEIAKVETVANNLNISDQIRGEATIRLSDLKKELRREFDTEYRLNLPKARDAGALGLVKSLKPNQFGVGVEMYDAQAALVTIGKHLNLWGDEGATVVIAPFKIYEGMDPDKV